MSSNCLLSVFIFTKTDRFLSVRRLSVKIYRLFDFYKNLYFLIPVYLILHYLTPVVVLSCISNYPNCKKWVRFVGVG